MANVDKQVALIMNEIDRQGGPLSMTRIEWRDFLEGIIEECKIRSQSIEIDGDDDE